MARVTDSDQTVIRLEDVSYSYPGAGSPVLSNLSFTISKGEFVAVAGPTGCGKSTLALILSRIIPGKLSGDFSGTAAIDGRVGIMFQNPDSQLFSLKVSEEIAFGPVNFGCSADETLQRVRFFSGKTGVEDLLDRSPNRLSSGQRQRTALASVLSARPDILVLDEPTAYLDPVGKTEIMHLLTGLNADGTTVVLIEHNLDLISGYARRVIFVNNEGKIDRDEDCSRASVCLDFPAVKGDNGKHVGMGIPGKVAVQLKSVSYVYPDGTAALHNIDLCFFAGEFTAVLGENGSGKSTLAKTLNALIVPSQGEVTVLGGAPSPEKVGYAFQNPDYQIFERTVFDEIAFGPKNLGFSAQKVEECVNKAMHAVGLQEYRDADPHILSAGQKRCTVIASALAMEPRILVLDEPGAGLDRQKALDLMRVVLNFNRKGNTVIVLSHDIPLVSSFCRRAIVLEKGEVRFNGGIEGLKKITGMDTRGK